MRTKNINVALACSTLALGTFLAISNHQTKAVWEIVMEKDKEIHSLSQGNEFLNQALLNKEIEEGEMVINLKADSDNSSKNILNDTSYPYESFERIMSNNFLNVEEVDTQWLYNTCLDFGVNPVVVLSTFALETGWGTSNLWVYSNNSGGLVCTDGNCDRQYQAYDTKTSGLAHMIAEMHRYIYVYGFSTVEEFRGLWSGNTDCSQFMAIVNQVYRG